MKNRGKAIISLMLAVSIFVLGSGGCGKAGKTEWEAADAGEIIETDSVNGMGRYVENSLQFPVDMERSSALFLQKDGSILCYDMAERNGLMRSKDSGISWEHDSRYELEGNDDEIDRIVFGPDGDSVITYGKGDKKPYTDSYAAYSYTYKKASDEMEQILELSPTISDGKFEQFAFSPDGKLYAADNMGSVFQIDKESGSQQKLFGVGPRVTSLMAGKQYIIAATWEGIHIYNNENGELEEHIDVLNEFFQTQGILFAWLSDAFPVIFREEEGKNSVLFVCGKGLYRYVVGGNVVEQLIDGGLGNFSNPGSQLKGFLEQEDGSFLILYSGNEMMHYVYREDIPSMPDIELDVYSLRENDAVLSAIHKYQKEHSDVYIRYEIGMTGEDGVTYEDAVKNLNTRILAKDGPDVIVLDDMSIDTYIEKGVLADLSEVFESISEKDYLTNITNIFCGKDGKFAVPARFAVPVIVGEKDILNSVSDIGGLADAAKAMREDKNTGNIVGIYTPEELLEILTPGMWPQLVNEDGVNREELQEFLSHAKQIYETEQEGYTEEMKLEMNGAYSYGTDIEDPFSISKGIVGIQDFVTEKTSCELGYAASFYTYAEMAAILRHDLEKTFTYAPAGGKKVFRPFMILGMTANSSQPELAADFIKSVLSEENQVDGIGYPVNRKAIEEQLQEYANTPEKKYGESGLTTESGDVVTMTVFPLSGAECRQVVTFLEELDTPDTLDEQTRELLSELAEDALTGTKSVEDTVNEIVGRIQLCIQE